MEDCLLLLYTPPSLEESVVDWLLENAEAQGFSTAEVFGHGMRQTGMSLLEQVTGRQRRIQFQVQADRELAARLVADLGQRFAGAGLYYVILPVSDCGSL